MVKRKQVSFEAELIEGHKGVTAVIVPFDPEEAFGEKPIRLDARRHGWLVTGTIDGARFEGYIGERWGRFFIQVDKELREAADVQVGDRLKVRVSPTRSASALAHARVLAQSTTAPKRPRADAIDPPA